MQNGLYRKVYDLKTGKNPRSRPRFLWGSIVLAAKAPEAARRAGQTIERQFLLPETAPDIDRPFPEMPELRELVIAFRDSGYAALYRHEPADDVAYILAFRHQEEAGY